MILFSVNYLQVYSVLNIQCIITCSLFILKYKYTACAVWYCILMFLLKGVFIQDKIVHWRKSQAFIQTKSWILIEHGISRANAKFKILTKLEIEYPRMQHRTEECRAEAKQRIWIHDRLGKNHYSAIFVTILHHLWALSGVEGTGTSVCNAHKLFLLSAISHLLFIRFSKPRHQVEAQNVFLHH